MAERVIDLLESIEVNEQHADRRAAGARPLERRAKLISKEAPIRQPRQTVVVCKLSYLIFCMLALGDVLNDPMYRHGATRFVAIDLGFDMYDPDLPVWPRYPTFEFHLSGAGECLAKQHLNARALVFDGARPHEPVGQAVFLLRQARDWEALFRKLDPTRRDVPFPASKTRNLLCLRQLRTTFGKLFAHARGADHVAQPFGKQRPL